MADLTLITPTGDRPVALSLCAGWMARQTFTGTVQWVIIDDGEEPFVPLFARDGWEIEHVCPLEDVDGPKASFHRNLWQGLRHVESDLVAIIEDDDYYAPVHLEELVRCLWTCELAGHGVQRYYQLPTSRWVELQNIGASLCQTGLRRSVLGQLQIAIDQASDARSIGVDRALWDRCTELQVLTDLRMPATVVGMKGLPGRKGLGAGHTDHLRWNMDPGGAKLREWLGSDADHYEALTMRTTT